MIEYHKHTGQDGTPQLDPKDFLGFPFFRAVPTHKALEGTQVYVETGGNYYLYVMLDKVWRGVQLPL